MKTPTRMSTAETVELPAVIQQQQDKEILTIRIAVQHQLGKGNLGIGVAVTDDNNSFVIGWAMNEKSSGSKSLDEAIAVRLALCKAVSSLGLK